MHDDPNSLCLPQCRVLVLSRAQLLPHVDHMTHLPCRCQILIACSVSLANGHYCTSMSPVFAVRNHLKRRFNNFAIDIVFSQPSNWSRLDWSGYYQLRAEIFDDQSRISLAVVDQICFISRKNIPAAIFECSMRRKGLQRGSHIHPLAGKETRQKPLIPYTFNGLLPSSDMDISRYWSCD